ncbi:MAG TPA: hypothetical protein VGI74_22945 [Streptosporangiaceae bacterium]|jgi:hypothetical protein
MFGLLIVIAAVTIAIGATAAVIVLVAWAVRREDHSLTMADPAPSRAAHTVRRLLGLYATGVATPGQDQHTVRGDDPGPWQDPDDSPADWPGPRGPGPARWDTPVGV